MPELNLYTKNECYSSWIQWYRSCSRWSSFQVEL